MATKDERTQIWYTDGSGNVTGYTESVGDIAGTIIDAYNAHYGTDISIWTPETKTLQVGGTVPNWDAYEKIEMPKYLKLPIAAGTRVVTAAIIENVFRLMVRGSGKELGALYVTVSTGAVYSITYDLSIEEVFYNRALDVYPGITLGTYLETTYVPGDIIDLTSYVEV